ncbi:hypothetical protein D0S45_19720 [Marinifilum sp. JC120]|nr:hypothetical protein D0S45_19720 [Marinifilum sp. JC120]
MKISDEFLVQRLVEKYGTLTKVALRLGYSGYRPFQAARKKGFPEAKRLLAMMLLLEEESHGEKR